MKKEGAINQLRQNGLKATTARIAVLQFFDKQKIPVSIEKILKNISNIDKVTIYRMVEDFTRVGLISRHDIGHNHQDYELTSKGHHHHLICSICGLIEDIEVKHEHNLLKKVLAKSKNFIEIDKHQISFYGICKKCIGGKASS